MPCKFVIIAGIAFLPIMLFGQREVPVNLKRFDQEFLHLGYLVGTNTMNFIIEANEGYMIETRENPGLCVNMVSGFRITKYLELKFHPGMVFGQRDLHIRGDTTKGGIESSWHARLESVYLDFPLLLKYKAMRVNNYAPYLICGIAPKIDIYGSIIEKGKRVLRLIKSFDYFPELGVGVDFYLFKVKMAAELKFSIGQLNIYIPTINEDAFKLFGNSINQMRSKILTLSLQFEGLGKRSRRASRW